MNLILQPLSRAPLKWKDRLPDDYCGILLPGGEPSSAQGEFGTICIQEFRSPQFTIQLKVFDLLKKMTFRTAVDENCLSGTLLLKGKLDISENKKEKWSVQQNQFILNQAPYSSIISLDRKLHICLETCFDPQLVKEYISTFPVLSMPMQPQPTWSGMTALSIVKSMMSCTYTQVLQHKYFETRVKDLLFEYLLHIPPENLKPIDRLPTEKELAAIHMVEKIITEDIKMHFTIPELSRRVLLNDFRLKQLFKLVYGRGPYEYLVGKRMEMAKQLLEQGCSVKETAIEVGYRPSDLTIAFRQHFGFTPGSIKKRS